MIHRHGIVGIRLVLHHGSVLLDIAGQRPNRYLIVALGVNGKNARVRRFGSLDGTGNAVRGAQFVAIERIARDCRPGVFFCLVQVLIGAFEHDGKGRTRANGVVLVVFYVFGQEDGLLGGQIAAVQPHAAALPCAIIRCFDRRLRCDDHAARATRRSWLVLQMQLAWRCGSR